MTPLHAQFAVAEMAARGYPRLALLRGEDGTLKIQVTLDNEALQGLASRLLPDAQEHRKPLALALSAPLRVTLGCGQRRLHMSPLAEAPARALDVLLLAVERDLEGLSRYIATRLAALERATEPEAIVAGGVLLHHRAEGFTSRLFLVRDRAGPMSAGQTDAGTLLADLAEGRAVRYGLRAEIEDAAGSSKGSAFLAGIQDSPDLAEGYRLGPMLLHTAAEDWREKREAAEGATGAKANSRR